MRIFATVIALGLIFLLAACGGNPASGTPTPIVSNASGGGAAQSTGEYDVRVTGAVTFTANILAANRTPDGRIILSFYFRGQQNAVIVSIPPNLAAVGEIEVNDQDLPSARRANISVTFLGDQNYSFARNASGTITITALDENKVSGSFNVTVEDPEARTVNAVGTFSDVTFRVYE